MALLLQTENTFVLIHIIFLVALAISYLSDTFKRYLYEDFYKFFNSNREVILGSYYAYVAFDYYRKWKSNRISD